MRIISRFFSPACAAIGFIRTIDTTYWSHKRIRSWLLVELAHRLYVVDFQIFSRQWILLLIEQVKNGFIHIEGNGPCQPEIGQEEHCITFYHYNLKYEGQIVLETTTRDRKALRYYKLRMRNNGIRYIRAIDRFKRSQDSREVSRFD